MTSGRELVPAENYLVCERIAPAAHDIPSGSVRERCFACESAIVLYPNSQKLLNDRPELKLKLVCSSCYMSAPDKDRIRPAQPMPLQIADYLRKSK